MKYKGTIISEGSGSLGGITFSHNRGGQYIRHRAVPVNSNTPQQQAMRNIVTLLVAHWNSTLTGAQRDGWSAYAAAVTYVDALGEPRVINGMSMYMACTPRVQAAMTRIDAPPTTLVRPSFTAPTYTVTAPLTGSLAFTNSDLWAVASGGAMLLYTSRGMGQGINYFKLPRPLRRQGAGGRDAAYYPGQHRTRVQRRRQPARLLPAQIVMADGRLSGRCACFASAASPAPAPVPVSAAQSWPTNVVVTFDLSLSTLSLLPANWLVRHDNTLYRASTAASLNYDVTLTGWTTLGGNAGDDAVTYLASPPDLHTPALGYAAPFTDFPFAAP